MHCCGEPDPLPSQYRLKRFLWSRWLCVSIVPDCSRRINCRNHLAHCREAKQNCDPLIALPDPRFKLWLDNDNAEVFGVPNQF